MFSKIPQQPAIKNKSSLPPEFDSLLKQITSNVQQVINLERFFKELCQKIVRRQFGWNMFSQLSFTDRAAAWSTQTQKQKEKIVRLITLLAHEDHQHYLCDNKSLCANLILLAAKDKSIAHLLEMATAEHRLQLSSRLYLYCSEQLVSFDEIILPLQIKIIKSLYFLIKYAVAPTVGYEHTDEDFVAYTKLPRKIVEDPLYGPIGDINLFKLHLTFYWDDYYTHQEQLTQLLVNYILDDTIAEFKFISPNLLLGLSTNLESYLIKMGLSTDTLGPSRRYIMGAQFTIYLPTANDPRYNPEKIAQMCSVLATYCTENNLRAGACAPIEDQLTPHLLFRCDRLAGKYISAETKNEKLIKKNERITSPI